MRASRLVQQLLAHLKQNGYDGRVVSLEHPRELEEGVEGYHRQGLIDEKLFKTYLEAFVFKPPENLPDAKSLIVTAAPQPQFGVTFNFEGQSYSTVIPLTYLHYADEEVKSTVSEILDPHGYHLAWAVVPNKLLAVRSGLARYGKNNVSYIPGMGSFYRLRTLYTDLPCIEDNWQEPQMLEECEKCQACIKSCPTNAIASDRFFLHAERCIAFFNESEDDFPDWLDPSWHNALIGCMICQKVCPVNKDFVDWIEDKAEFSEGETALLLKGIPFDQHSPGTQTKLAAIECTDGLSLVARNLAALLPPLQRRS